MTATVKITADGPYARQIIEHIINPALKAYEITVEWPGYPNDATITATFDQSEIRVLTQTERTER